MKTEFLQSYRIKWGDNETKQNETMIEQSRMGWENWTRVDWDKLGNHTEWLAVETRCILMWWGTIEDLKTK